MDSSIYNKFLFLYKFIVKCVIQFIVFKIDMRMRKSVNSKYDFLNFMLIIFNRFSQSHIWIFRIVSCLTLFDDKAHKTASKLTLDLRNLYKFRAETSNHPNADVKFQNINQVSYLTVRSSSYQRLFRRSAYFNPIGPFADFSTI